MRRKRPRKVRKIERYPLWANRRVRRRTADPEPQDREMPFGLLFSFRMIRCAKDWRFYVRRCGFVAPAEVH